MKQLFLSIILFQILLISFLDSKGQSISKIDSLEKLIIAPNTVQDTSYVNTLNTLSNAYKFKNSDKSLEYAGKALKLSEKLSYKKGMSIAFKIMGIAYYGIGKYEKAFEFYHKSLKICELINDKKGIANLYNNIAIIYLQKSDYKNAIDYHLKALQIRKAIKDHKGMASSYNNIGNIYYEQGDFSKGITYYNKSLKIKKEIGDSIGIANIYNGMGNIYMDLADYATALDHGFKSLKIKEKLNDEKGIATSFNNIGIIYEKLRDYVQALDYHKKSLKIKEKIGDKHGMRFSYLNIGNVYEKQKKYDEALSYYSKSLDISKETDDKIGESISFNSIGSIYFKTAKPTKALDYLFNAVKINEEIGNKRGLVSSFTTIGEVYISSKNYSKAEQYLFKGLTLSKKIEKKTLTQEVYKKLSELYDLTHNTKQSYLYYKKYTAIKDSIFNERENDKMTKLQIKHATEKQEQEILLLEEREKSNAIKLEGEEMKRYILSAGIGLLIILAFLLFNRYRIKQRSNEKLTKAHTILEQKNKDITDSINYAKRIQEAILPSLEKIKRIFPESFIYYKPRDIVSGDFYWTSKKGNNTLIAAVDCTGHGVPGAFMSMIGNILLNEIVNEKGITRPAEILNQLRDGVVNALKQEGTAETTDGMDIAFCCINPDKNQLEYAGTSIPLYQIHNGQLTELKGGGFPIGIHTASKQQAFTNHILAFAKNDTFYISSDGYTDQFGGPYEKKFTRKRFKELLLSMHDMPIKDQERSLDKAFQIWKKNTEQTDDILIIGFKI